MIVLEYAGVAGVTMILVYFLIRVSRPRRDSDE